MADVQIEAGGTGRVEYTLFDAAGDPLDLTTVVLSAKIGPDGGLTLLDPVVTKDNAPVGECSFDLSESDVDVLATGLNGRSNYHIINLKVDNTVAGGGIDIITNTLQVMWTHFA